MMTRSASRFLSTFFSLGACCRLCFSPKISCFRSFFRRLPSSEESAVTWGRRRRRKKRMMGRGGGRRRRGEGTNEEVVEV